MNHERNATGKGRILVVDDERLNRILLSTNLEESGYTVETAEDGRQALQMLGAQSFDAVLLDLIMPRMDGYQVLAEMKRDALLRRIPVIVISSMDEMESIVRCIEMGATDYLAKPFNPVLLHARIQASLASLHEERMAALREQYAQVTAAQEEERQRIARELHDGLGPDLASLNIRLLTVRRLLEREGHPVAGEIEELAEQAQASIRDIRRLIKDLRPVALDELGLVPALREHLARCEQEHDLVVEFAADDGERLPAAVETALFRIVQEAVNNVLRHAQADQVCVTLIRDDSQARLCIADDGQGFDTRRPRSSKHIGLWSMRERVEQLGGQFEVSSTPGQGTTVTTVVPL
jgi:signal transduction histidine kinase